MLDDAKRIASVDSRDMLGCVERMPQHLSEGLRSGREVILPKSSTDSLVICGLGGSAIAGDVLSAWLSTESEVRCEVVRGYSIPRQVSQQSLVVVSSYSGNTEETMSMLDDARARSLKTVAVSSGGRLKDLAGSMSMPLVHVPEGMVPRASFGYMFGALLGIVERCGIASPETQLEESLRVLTQLGGECASHVPTKDNPAKKMAHELHGTVPVFIGHGLSAPVAKRWANQMNENAKSIAFSSELPEMDHNEIVFWDSDPRSQGFSAVLLDHDFSDRRMNRRLEATRQVVCGRSRVHVVKAAGVSPLAQALSLIATGDYVSIYSAVLRGEDPSTTGPIEELKRIISEG